MTALANHARLVRLPALVCYRDKGKVVPLPDRMRYLDAAAAPSFLTLAEEGLTVTDVYRSVQTSANIYGSRKGAARPGSSGHNWGLSIDIDVTDAMRLFLVDTKRGLDISMAARGWYCHRLDGVRGHEEWHYNYFGMWAPQGKFSSDDLDRRILQLHPHLKSDFAIDDEQKMLTLAGYECGAIDGIAGPKTRAARAAFRSQHRIGDNEDLHYRRALWATAQRELVK